MIYMYVLYFYISTIFSLVRRESRVDFNSFFNSKTSQKCIKINGEKREMRLKRRF